MTEMYEFFVEGSRSTGYIPILCKISVHHVLSSLEGLMFSYCGPHALTNQRAETTLELWSVEFLISYFRVTELAKDKAAETSKRFGWRTVCWRLSSALAIKCIDS